MMNFFKSVFSDDPETSDDLQSVSQIESDQSESVDDDQDGDGDHFKAGSDWYFGGLIKTIASKSESVIQTYRKDLEDFGSGLRMETAVIRDVASRAVEDLPATLEVGAIVAQESLESFGQAIDDFGSTVWKGTAEIIAQGKESILAVDDQDSSSEHSSTTSRGLNFSKYSRFEALMRAMQCYEGTYCDELEDKGDYDDWKLGFEVGDKGSEIMDLIAENEAMEGLYKKLVPEKLDHETFWSRYYYKLNKLKQVEEARERIVKRALASVDDEDLSWDIDDNDDGTGEFDVLKSNISDLAVEGIPAEKSMLSAARNGNVSNEVDDRKADRCDSGNDSDLSVVSSHPSFPEEGDLGWDKIEDAESHDERAVRSGSPCKIDSHKHTDGAEEDEDLSWGIEDDEEPSKP